MQIRFVLPPSVDSPLARLDPRWRLAGLVGLLAAIASARTLAGSLAGLAVAVGLTLVARPPRAWLVGRLLGLGVIVGAFVVPLPLLADGGVIDGLRLAGLFFLKAMGLFLVSSVLLVTAPLEATLAAAGSLGVPRLLTALTRMSLRYLFLLGEELARLRIALRVRGFRNRPGMHSYRIVAAATGMLLVRGNARAVRVAQAMRCRGFNGRFLHAQQKSTTIRDIVFFMVCLATALSLVLLDYGLFSAEGAL